MKKACLFISILFFGVPLAHAQASVSLSPVARQFFLNEITGLPLTAGKLCTYQAGTTTPQATYVDSTGVSQNTNPIILDSEGQANIWLVNGEKYKFVLYDNAGTPNTCTGNLQWTVDNISAAGGGNVTGCAVTGPLNSVLFINPLGACDGVSKFTTNDAGQVDINNSGTLEIDSPLTPLNDFTFAQGHQVYVQSDSANWDGSTTDGFTAIVGDSATPPQTSGALTGTNVTVETGTITVAATGASTLFYKPGTYAYIAGCTAATQLNGNIYQVANATPSQFVVINTGLDDYTSTPDSCTVELQESSNPSPFYSEAPASSTNWGGTYVSFNSQTGGENPQAHVLIDFLGGLFGDGPEDGYVFDAQDHSLTQIESAQFIAETNGSGQSEGNHAYALKIGAQDYTPWGWMWEDGSFYSRAGFSNVSSVLLGFCTASTGLNDCTPSLNTAGGGPPASETLKLKVCVTGSTYDTLDWTIDGSTPTCASQHMLAAPTYPTPIIDDIAVVFASATGHTLSAIFTLPVTVSYGTQIESIGGTYLSSVPLPTPNSPGLTPSPTGATSWSYCVSETWNGITTNCSTVTTIVDGPATLDSGDTISVHIGNATANPAIQCTLYRTGAGGTPSTTGIVAGPSNALCSENVTDNGLAGDSSSPPETNYTGYTVLADGYLLTPPGVPFTFPGITGNGCIGITSGAVGSAAVPCSGGGGSPGSPNLSIQGNSSTSFVGIPATLFSATNGITQIENKGSAGITLDSTATDFSGGGTGPIVFKSAGKILGADNSSTGIEFLEAGSGHLDLWATGAGGLIFDATGNGSGTGAGSGALTGYSKAGIALTDNSSTGITLTESGASSITFAGAVTATSTINAATGFEIGGAAASGHYLRGNGTNYIDGTIQAGDLPATVVLTNQSNTFSTGTQSFAAAAHLYAPVGAGAVGATNGEFDFDSTGKNYHGFADGANSIFSSFAAGLGPVNGDCVTWIVSGSNVLQGDSGNPCGSGGGGAGTVTSVSTPTPNILFTPAVATSTTTPVITFPLNTAAGFSWFGVAGGSTAVPAFNTTALPNSVMPNPGLRPWAASSRRPVQPRIG